jgi:hypothetical protein
MFGIDENNFKGKLITHNLKRFNVLLVVIIYLFYYIGKSEYTQLGWIAPENPPGESLLSCSGDCPFISPAATGLTS